MSMNKNEGKISFELLSHFQCASCSKWWSIGDADQSKNEWFCPWCGELGIYHGT